MEDAPTFRAAGAGSANLAEFKNSSDTLVASIDPQGNLLINDLSIAGLLTGTPDAPTASPGTNTTQIATTAFVTTADNLKANLASPTFTGTVTIPSGASIAGFALLAGPTFTGTPTLPSGTIATTQTASNNTTAIATTAYVDTADALVIRNTVLRLSMDVL